MKLDLRELIVMPDKRLSFEQELDVSRLDFPSVTSYDAPPLASGEVRNVAGVLRIEGELTASMSCLCDRCGKAFHSVKVMPVDAVAITEDEPENPGAFLLEGELLDLDEVLETAFILDMETKFLCDEDCKGRCPSCGKDLNEGPCSCRRETDPRLAVLQQLLDNKE